MDDNCESCVFWRKCNYYAEHEGVTFGECRRNSQVLNKNDATIFPEIASNGWCGEYRRWVEERV
jgi:hypothetical protein